MMMIGVTHNDRIIMIMLIIVIMMITMITMKDVDDDDENDDDGSEINGSAKGITKIIAIK